MTSFATVLTTQDKWHFSVQEWQKMQLYFYVFLKQIYYNEG